MKNKLFKLFICLMMFGALFNANKASAQTAGTMSFTVNPVAHSGQYSNGSNNGENHFVVIWLQNGAGSFIKTKLRTGAASDVNQHCQVWVANSGSNVVDATSAATLFSYTPITNTLWDGTDVIGTTPFNLVPDGTYRVFVENAWDASYVLGAGRDTVSVLWTKGPSPVTLTPADVTNFGGMSLTWTPAAPNTITTSAVAPTTYAAGAAISVPFTIGAGTVYNNNIWTAQLSNASGSFASPVAIGTLVSTTAGTVSATIPVGTPNGTGYRVRVVGSQPATIGTDNGVNITVNNGVSPTLVAAIGATVDNPFNVTFADDAAWRGAVTSVTIDGTTLTGGYSIAAGTITFTPSASVPASLLQTIGNKNIKVIATGYGDASVIQNLGYGLSAKLGIKTQPVAPTTSGTVFTTQPAVYVQDQYGNLTGSAATVNATVGSGAWTIGGSAAVAASSGTATFTNLTGTSASNVTGTITFTSAGLTSVTSNSFIVSVPIVAGTVTVGAAGNYTSFTKAGGLFEAINASGLAGNVTVNVISDITDEDGANALNQWNEFSGSGYTLTIQPTGGAARVVSGTVAGPLFNFKSADRVTINGLNTGGNSLTISNLSTSNTLGTSTIQFINDATNNTITNATILGSGTTNLTTNGGTIFIGTGLVTGNDNISILNSKIGAAGTNLPSKGIFANGSISSQTIANSTVVVDNCEIYDFFTNTGCAGLYAYTGNTAWSITNNKVYETTPLTFTASSTIYGIYFISPVTGDNVQITGNTIGYASNAATGLFDITGTASNAGAFQGINLAAASNAATTCNVSNNNVSAIKLTGTNAQFLGINNTTTAGASNVVTLNGNNISDITLVTTTGTAQAFYAGGAATLNLTNNVVNNFTRSGAGTIYGVRYNLPTTFNCTGNTFNNISFTSATGTSTIYILYCSAEVMNENIVGNTISNITSNSTAAQPIIGWYSTKNLGTKVFKNNTIFNITAAAGAATIYGVRGGSASLEVSGNNIYSLSGGANVYGISVSVGNNNIFKNKIYDLFTGNTNPKVYGILASDGTTNNIYNNVIGDLRAPLANAALPVQGINIAGTATTTANVYFNTINLNATSTGALFGSTAVSASTTPIVDLRNNILVNTSTPMGAGITSAYVRSDATLTTYAATSNNNVFYAGTPGANNVIMSDGTTSYQTLAAYQAAMATRDGASFTENPTWVSTSGSNSAFLHINTTTPTVIESGAAPIATYTQDFDGDVRNASTPDVGADEFMGVKACSGTPNASAINTIPSLCTGAGTTLSLNTSYADQGINYQWGFSLTPGGPYTDLGVAATQATGNLTATTYYICKVTCANSGLNFTTPEATATVISPATPGVTVTNLCGSSQLTATGVTGTVAWSTLESTNTITVTVAGPYTVTQTISGCTSAVGSGVAAPFVAAAVTITPSLNVITSSATTGNQWYSVATGLIVGETGQVFTATGNGDYYSVVTDGNGCVSTSNTVTILGISIDKNSLTSNVKIYPNPTSNNINIAFNQLSGNCKLAIANTLGATIYEENLEQINGLVKSIDMSSFANGVYFVNIEVQNSNLKYKVILNR